MNNWKYFIIKKIWNIEYINKNFNFNIIKLWCIEIEYILLEKDEFLKQLPLINWYCWRYYFYEKNFKFDEDYILWTNIYDINFEKNFNNIENLINEKNKYLLTRTKKIEYKNYFKNLLFNISSPIINIILLSIKQIENKKTLENINTNEIDLKANVNILKFISENNNLLEKFIYFNNKLETYSNFLYQYMKDNDLL